MPVLVVRRILTEHVPEWERFGNFLAGDAPPVLDEDEAEAESLVDKGAGAEDEPAARVATEALVAAETNDAH